MDRQAAGRAVIPGQRANALHALVGLAPKLPGCLVGPEQYERVLAVTRAQPSFFEWLVLECRLDEADAAVDVMYCVGSEADARECVRSVGVGSLESYPSLSRTLSTWAAPTGSLDKMPLLWLEYDLPSASSSGWGKPVLWFRLQDMNSYRNADEQVELMDSALAIAGESLPNGSRDLLQRLMRRLPWGLIDIGGMAVRGRDSVKVESRCRLSALSSLLSDVGWPGNRQQLMRLLEIAGPYFREVGIQLELSDALEPYLAIELPLFELDVRAARELCGRLAIVPRVSKSKLEVLPAWGGSHVTQHADFEWPVHVQRSAYVKLVAEADGTTRVKAYLCAYPRFTLAH